MTRPRESTNSTIGIESIDERRAFRRRRRRSRAANSTRVSLRAWDVPPANRRSPLLQRRARTANARAAGCRARTACWRTESLARQPTCARYRFDSTSFRLALTSTNESRPTMSRMAELTMMIFQRIARSTPSSRRWSTAVPSRESPYPGLRPRRTQGEAGRGARAGVNGAQFINHASTALGAQLGPPRPQGASWRVVGGRRIRFPGILMLDQQVDVFSGGVAWGVLAVVPMKELGQ